MFNWSPVARSKTVSPRPGTAVAYIHFAGMSESVEEEYVLMDFSAMTSAIGGIVGMMLGWSVLDVARLGAAVAARHLPDA